MKRLIDNIFRQFTVLFITGTLLFSGSTLSVISSVLESTIECCCSDNSSLEQDEAYKCGQDCCIITETKAQKIEGSLPLTIQLKDNVCINILINNVPEKDNIAQFNLSEDNFKNKPQKIFLITSVFRI